MSRLFGIDGDRVTAWLSVEDKALLVQIPDLVASVRPHGDQAHLIVNRAAYRDDDEASAEFASLVASQLDSDRARDMEALAVLTADSPQLTGDEARAVLRVINAARLTLAARAGVFDEGPGWESNISNDPALAAVAWLGFVQSELIAALTEL
jgi:hypothetical protein